MTNGERIRSMTDEELAAHLERFDCSYPICPCSLNICTEKDCSDAWIDWLKKEEAT